MVRSKWKKTILASAAWAGLAWGQTASAAAPAPLAVPGQTMTVQEGNKPAQKCAVLKTWRTANGSLAFKVQALDTGEIMTIVENGPTSYSPPPTAGGSRVKQMATRIFRWGKNGTSPAGAPVPPAELVNAQSTSVYASRPAAGTPAPRTQLVTGESTSVYAGRPAAGTPAPRTQLVTGESTSVYAGRPAAGTPAPRTQLVTGESTSVYAGRPAAGAPAPRVEQVSGESTSVYAGRPATGTPAPRIIPIQADNSPSPYQVSGGKNNPSPCGPVTGCGPVVHNTVPVPCPTGCQPETKVISETIVMQGCGQPVIKESKPGLLTRMWQKIKPGTSATKNATEIVEQPPVVAKKDQPKPKEVAKTQLLGPVEKPEPTDLQKSWGRPVDHTTQLAKNMPPAGPQIVLPPLPPPPVVASLASPLPPPPPVMSLPPTLPVSRDPLTEPEKYIKKDLGLQTQKRDSKKDDMIALPPLPAAPGSTMVMPVPAPPPPPPPVMAKSLPPVVPGVDKPGMPLMSVPTGPVVDATGSKAPMGFQSVLAATNGLPQTVKYVPVPIVTVPSPNKPPPPPAPQLPEAPQPNEKFVNAFSMPDEGSNPQGGGQPGAMPGMYAGRPVPGGIHPTQLAGYHPSRWQMYQGMPGMPASPAMMPNPAMAMQYGQPMMMPGMPPQGMAYGRPYAMPGYGVMPAGYYPMPAPGMVPGAMPMQPAPSPYLNPAAGHSFEAQAMPQHVQQMVTALREALLPSHREWAVDGLAASGVKSHEVVQALVRAGKEDPAATVRAAAVRGLMKMNVTSTPVIQAIAGMKNDADPRVRLEVEQVMAKFGPDQIKGKESSTIQQTGGSKAP